MRISSFLKSMQVQGGIAVVIVKLCYRRNFVCYSTSASNFEVSGPACPRLRCWALTLPCVMSYTLLKLNNFSKNNYSLLDKIVILWFVVFIIKTRLKMLSRSLTAIGVLFQGFRIQYNTELRERGFMIVKNKYYETAQWNTPKIMSQQVSISSQYWIQHHLVAQLQTKSKIAPSESLVGARLRSESW